MAKLVAHLIASGSNPDISQKYEMGDISNGVQLPTHYSPSKKNIQKSMSVTFGSTVRATITKSFACRMYSACGWFHPC